MLSYSLSYSRHVDFRDKRRKLLSMNTRQTALISFLVKEAHYVTTKALATKFDVSERTLAKDLNLLANFLVAEHMPLVLERKKGTGIWLKGFAHEKEKLLRLVATNDLHIEEDELQKLLIFHILQTPNGLIKLDELADQLFLSRRIIQEELKKLRVFFQHHGLEIISKPGVGTRVIGNENKKRQLLIQTLRNMKRSKIKTPSLNEFFKQDTLKVIQDTLRDILLENNIVITKSLSNIEIHIYFMLERMRRKGEITLTQSETDAVNDTPAQQVSSQVLATLSTIYPIEFSPDEINYLALRIASTFPSASSALYFEEEATVLTNYLIDQVDDVLNYTLITDEVLKANLISHLTSTYFRLNYNLNISNPLTTNVFSAYPQLFLVLQLILDDYFKQKSYFVPQEEIAYLAIHFQAAIERQKQKQTRHFRVILVSEYSKAMATFIEARLNRELPELKVIDLIEYTNTIIESHFRDADFILSTVPFHHPTFFVLEISPMINANDVLNIEKYIVSYEPSSQLKKFDLSSFTNPFLIFPQSNLNTPEDILKFMGENLVTNDYVEAQFVSEVLSRDRQSSIRVAPLISLPHANPSFVKQSTISILTLKEPIDWHGEPISLVILIAVKKEQLKNVEFKKLFSVIHYLEQSPEKVHKICQNKHALDILNLLSEYE